MSWFPLPDEAAAICPGCALASAISSPTDWAGKLGYTTSIDGELAIRMTGVRSRTGSKRMFRYMLRMMAIAELVHSTV